MTDNVCRIISFAANGAPDGCDAAPLDLKNDAQRRVALQARTQILLDCALSLPGIEFSCLFSAACSFCGSFESLQAMGNPHSVVARNSCRILLAGVWSCFLIFLYDQVCEKRALQGDFEKHQGLPVSEIGVRNISVGRCCFSFLDFSSFRKIVLLTHNGLLRTNQKNFIGNVVLALYKLCGEALPSTKGVCNGSIEQMKKNHARWAALNY